MLFCKDPNSMKCFVFILFCTFSDQFDFIPKYLADVFIWCWVVNLLYYTMHLIIKLRRIRPFLMEDLVFYICLVI